MKRSSHTKLLEKTEIYCLIGSYIYVIEVEFNKQCYILRVPGCLFYLHQNMK